MKLYHTMIRVKDLDETLAFYTGFLGLKEVRRGQIGDEATLVFLTDEAGAYHLELTYNHDGRSYDVGTGYGHVAIGVDDLDSTLAALQADHGIEPARPPYQVREGGSRICFVRDPDDYRIELIERGS